MRLEVDEEKLLGVTLQDLRDMGFELKHISRNNPLWCVRFGANYDEHSFQVGIQNWQDPSSWKLDLEFRVNLQSRHICSFQNSQLAIANPTWASSGFLTTHKHILYEDFEDWIHPPATNISFLPQEQMQLRVIELCDWVQENWKGGAFDFDATRMKDKLDWIY